MLLALVPLNHCEAGETIGTLRPVTVTNGVNYRCFQLHGRGFWVPQRDHTAKVALVPQGRGVTPVPVPSTARLLDLCETLTTQVLGPKALEPAT